MRVYIPVLPADVDRRKAEGVWQVTPRRAWAVNAQLAAALPDEDDEGREFIASLTAAHASAAGMAIAADVPATDCTNPGPDGDVDVAGVIAPRHVACVFRLDPADDESLLWFGEAEFDAFLAG